MASRDLAGLLTGINSAQRPDPNMDSDAWRMAFGGQQAQNLGNSVGNIGGMLGGERSLNPQEAIQIGMGKLDQNNIEDLKTLARMQQMRGDNRGFEQTTAKIQALQEKEADTKQRTSLIKMARAQDNPNMATWLEVGGDPKTAASVLLQQPKLATPEAYASMFNSKGESVRTAVIGGKLSKATEDGWATVKDSEKLYATNPNKKEDGAKASNLTKSNIEDYDAIIEQNPAIKKVLEVEGWDWWGSGKGAAKDAEKRVLLIKAEQLYTNNPELGREGALLQAAKIEKAQEANVSSDPDSNVTAN
tara:strand:- start:2930 stop:3838 length:909 start_codon:yes stop_codon:yes gene_type:complete